LATDPRLARSFGRVAQLYDRVRPNHSRQALDLLRAPYLASGRADAVETWRDAFVGSRFEPLREETFASEPTVDADTLLAMYQTTSSIAALGEGERAALVEEVRPLLVGPYELPVRVELTWTRLAS
jgi:hypothetical protein